MKSFITIVLLSALFLSACDIAMETGLNTYVDNAEKVDTSISVTDTLVMSFGSLGDEEGLSIVVPPVHAEYCAIEIEDQGERVLEYIPEQDFCGEDSLLIVLSTGSDGASPATQFDTIKITIVVTGPVLKNLMGEWQWIVSCGGFTGGCWYPDDDYKIKIKITEDSHFLRYENDSLVWEKAFTLTETHMNGETEITGLVFGDKPPQWFWFSQGQLCLQGGDFVETYDKL